VKALVTGANGFVGRHLCAHLRAVGDAVEALDADADPSVDITDAEAVRRAVAAAAPDVVFHLAARAHVGQSWTDADALRAVNVGGTEHVVDACVRSGVHRLVVVGSAEQYGAVGPERVPLREDAPMVPITPYGESKLAAENLAVAAFREHALGVVCVRAFNHAGPGQRPEFLVPGLAARIAEGERTARDEIAVGNLDPVRDFVDVRDVVRAYRLLAELGEPGEAYNVCSGRGVTVADLAARLVAMANRPMALRVDPALVRPVEVPWFVGDPSRLSAATGWKPEIGLEQTLADVLDAARRR
jgi:GDP-4-dehydro-6-deoxy-D-mannose reductase